MHIQILWQLFANRKILIYEIFSSLFSLFIAISQDGRLTTNAYMAEYNQDRFELEIQAKEVQPPERIAKAKVFVSIIFSLYLFSVHLCMHKVSKNDEKFRFPPQVWIYEPEQLVRVILSRPPSEVQSERDEILVELTNVTKNRIIIDDIRYHVDGVGRIRMDWTDMFFHAVDAKTKSIVPVFEVLTEIDSKYDFLKDYYSVSNRCEIECIDAGMMGNIFRFILIHMAFKGVCS